MTCVHQRQPVKTALWFVVRETQAKTKYDWVHLLCSIVTYNMCVMVKKFHFIVGFWHPRFTPGFRLYQWKWPLMNMLAVN